MLERRMPTQTPTGPTAEGYRIAGYADGLIGAAEPDCNVLLPHFDSGLTWPDENNPQPEDWLWDGGVAGGIEWDGTFWRDVQRYSASGVFFWAAYFKPGTAPGMKNGYWLNFGSGWSHLAEDNPALILSGASQRLFFDTTTQTWRLVIEATQFVTHAVIEVWAGSKQSGPTPAGLYTRLSGCDPAATLTIEAVP